MQVEIAVVGGEVSQGDVGERHGVDDDADEGVVDWAEALEVVKGGVFVMGFGEA